MMLSHKLDQEDMYNEYRPDIASDTPTMTITSTDSIPAAESYTDSIFHSYDENSDLKKAIVASLIVILCSINPIRSYISKIISIPWNAILILSSAFEDNQTEIMADIADDDDDKSFNSEVSTGTTHFFNSIRTRLDFLLRLFSCVFEVRFGFRRSAKISDEFEDSVESETESKGEASSTKGLSLLGTKKSKKKIIHNIAMPPESNTNKPIKKQEKVISFNADSIEPAFLNEESYPDDWMVYDANQGKLVKRSDLMREKAAQAQAQPIEAQSIETQPTEAQ